MSNSTDIVPDDIRRDLGEAESYCLITDGRLTVWAGRVPVTEQGTGRFVGYAYKYNDPGFAGPTREV